jgi:hypothetical protein
MGCWEKRCGLPISQENKYFMYCTWNSYTNKIIKGFLNSFKASPFPFSFLCSEFQVACNLLITVTQITVIPVPIYYNTGSSYLSLVGDRKDRLAIPSHKLRTISPSCIRARSISVDSPNWSQHTMRPRMIALQGTRTDLFFLLLSPKQHRVHSNCIRVSWFTFPFLFILLKNFLCFCTWGTQIYQNSNNLL